MDILARSRYLIIDDNGVIQSATRATYQVRCAEQQCD